MITCVNPEKPKEICFDFKTKLSLYSLSLFVIYLLFFNQKIDEQWITKGKNRPTETF
jgi:hypothetical protein